MLHRRKKNSAATPSAAEAPESAAPAQPGRAAELDETKSSTNEGAAEARHPASGTSAAAPSPAPKPGPGRPATRPHCLRCGRRLERCKCKEGALLPAEISKAAEEVKKQAVKPLTADEAEQLLRMSCWLLGIGESGLAALTTKLKLSEAEEIFAFTEEDIVALLPPASRVLAKYAHKIPAWMREYGAEMQLVAALYNVHRAKFARAAEVLAEKEKPARLHVVEKPAPKEAQA